MFCKYIAKRREDLHCIVGGGALPLLSFFFFRLFYFSSPSFDAAVLCGNCSLLPPPQVGPSIILSSGDSPISCLRAHSLLVLFSSLPRLIFNAFFTASQVTSFLCKRE